MTDSAISGLTQTRDTIPVIDIASLLNGDDPNTAAEQLAWAATHVGFIYVRNHGISRTVMGSARAAALEFFRHPLAQKQQVASNIHHHGYLRPGATKMYDDAELDLKESFNFGAELDADELNTEHHTLLGPNEWPDFLPELQAAIYPYYEAATTCAEALLRGFAIAAGLPERTFYQNNDRPVSRGSLQYYPPLPTDSKPGRFSLAAHTDFGMLTVLAQDELGGLQVQTMNGEWIDATPIPDTLVVNVGDLLGRWSNDTYRSTPHRVQNTSGKERLSLVLAYDPNAETIVDPKIFCTDGQSPKYDAISCGDYLLWRFAKAFSYRN